MKSKRVLVLEKTDGKCAICNISLQLIKPNHDNYMQIDHLIHKSMGGSNEIENLFPVCRSCNSSRGHHDSLDTVQTATNKIKSLFPKKFLKILSYEHKNNHVSKSEIISKLILIKSMVNDQIDDLIKEIEQ